MHAKVIIQWDVNLNFPDINPFNILFHKMQNPDR